jgi:hypothetical protein
MGKSVSHHHCLIWPGETAGWITARVIESGSSVKHRAITTSLDLGRRLAELAGKHRRFGEKMTRIQGFDHAT